MVRLAGCSAQTLGQVARDARVLNVHVASGAELIGLPRVLVPIHPIQHRCLRMVDRHGTRLGGFEGGIGGCRDESLGLPEPFLRLGHVATPARLLGIRHAVDQALVAASGCVGTTRAVTVLALNPEVRQVGSRSGRLALVIAAFLLSPVGMAGHAACHGQLRPHSARAVQEVLAVGIVAIRHSGGVQAGCVGDLSLRAVLTVDPRVTRHARLPRLLALLVDVAFADGGDGRTGLRGPLAPVEQQIGAWRLGGVVEPNAG